MTQKNSDYPQFGITLPEYIIEHGFTRLTGTDFIDLIPIIRVIRVPISLLRMVLEKIIEYADCILLNRIVTNTIIHEPMVHSGIRRFPTKAQRTQFFCHAVSMLNRITYRGSIPSHKAMEYKCATQQAIIAAMQLSS